MTVYPHTTSSAPSVPATPSLKQVADKAVELEQGATAEDVATVKAMLTPAMFPSQALYDAAIAEIDWITMNVTPQRALTDAAGYLTYLRIEGSTLTWKEYYAPQNASLNQIFDELAHYDARAT